MKTMVCVLDSAGLQEGKGLAFVKLTILIFDKSGMYRSAFVRKIAQ
jgi:hypothetical protein